MTMDNALAKHAGFACFLIDVQGVGIAGNLCILIYLILGKGKFQFEDITDFYHFCYFFYRQNYKF
jgi:hypothetical protein